MIIQSKNVWLDESFKAAQVEINEDKITGIYPYNEKPVDVDYLDKWILPGFIDIHCHGYAGVDSNKPTLKGMRKWCKHMPAEGVTSFLVTTSTQSVNKNERAMATYSRIIGRIEEGAEILGINMEGNFISKECKGAQNKRHIVEPDGEVLAKYQLLSGNNIISVTYAAEKDEDFSFVKKCNELGIVASIGHSDCSFQQAKLALKNGASAITHTGNGMKPFHHRKPGLFGAAVNLDGFYAEVIGDGIHVDFQTAYLIGRMKGKDKLILVTDSAVQKDDKKFNFLNKNGAYYLPDGTLFGSALYVNEGVNNLHKKAGLDLVVAINSATINPAKYCKCADRKGSLEAGKDADIVVTDENIKVYEVYCRGVKQEL
ncbi:MAG: N-acetylglucosamine-6-phosphate deacetylase [Bacillota bacterium]|jgi:N-acetylglucosamine-6-phosphate deacetylase|nr:N-acetylglucosamine-6-phosphate deacetylase [Bacillota bacterium]NLL26957.1 N-acetylglucosamine-6-phosphate deacetylase [Erysipelotrichia bacterium]